MALAAVAQSGNPGHGEVVCATSDLWHESMMLAIILMMIVTAMNVMTTFMITVMATIMMTPMTSLPCHASYVESAPGSSSAHLSSLLFLSPTPVLTEHAFC